MCDNVANVRDSSEPARRVASAIEGDIGRTRPWADHTCQAETHTTNAIAVIRCDHVTRQIGHDHVTLGEDLKQIDWSSPGLYLSLPDRSGHG